MSSITVEFERKDIVYTLQECANVENVFPSEFAERTSFIVGFGNGMAYCDNTTCCCYQLKVRWNNTFHRNSVYQQVSITSTGELQRSSSNEPD